jgi:hypothetical protein
MLKIFIAYRSLDAVRVDTIVSRLSTLRDDDGGNLYDIWRDKTNLSVGSDWWQAILDAIENCDVFILMVSKESVKSPYCRAEVAYAYALNIPILPLVLEGEWFDNQVVNKDDIDYWSDVPKEIIRLNLQFIFDRGNSGTINEVQKSLRYLAIGRITGAWSPLKANRPSEPRIIIGADGLIDKMGDRHDIFLSYSRKDDDIMQQVKQSFYEAGLSVWTDEGIEVGTDDWQEAIGDAIKDTKALVCICSPDAIASRWVKAELKRAELRKKPIFLILARGDELYAIPFGYEHHQFTDIRIPKSYDKEVQRLIITIRQKLGVNTQPLTPAPIPAPIGTISISSVGNKTKASLPAPFDWCEIPKGKVQVSTSSNVDEIPAFLIAKYPITNAQFASFIEADGYKNKAWWTDTGWQQKELNHWNEPRFWQTSQRSELEHPIIGISWYESLAFCLWLSGATDEKIMLPTHKQWQRAAQGDDKRAYPWGIEWDASRCNNNVDKMQLPQTTSVRRFEGKGDSPYKVVDMVGNTWEWCLTESASGLNTLDGENERGICGGSLRNTNIETFRVNAFFGNNPDSRSDNIGFRICLNLD